MKEQQSAHESALNDLQKKFDDSQEILNSGNDALKKYQEQIDKKNGELDDLKSDHAEQQGLWQLKEKDYQQQI